MSIAYRSKCLDYTVYGKSEQNGIPTPENPVEIKTIPSVANLIESKMPTTSVSGITCTYNEDGSYTLNGTATAGADFRINQSTRSGSDNLQNYNGTYTLSCEQLVDGVVVRMMQNSTWTIAMYVTSNAKEQTRTIDVNNAFVYIFIESGTTVNNLTIYPMLEQSPTAHPYVPYGHYLRIDDVSKNVFNKNNIINGFRLSASGDIYSESIYSVSDFIEVKPNSSYMLLKKKENASVYSCYCLYDSSKTFISRSPFIGDQDKITVNTTANTHYIRLTDLTDNINDVQLLEPQTYFINLAKENLFNLTSATGYEYGGGLPTAKGNVQIDYFDSNNLSFTSVHDNYRYVLTNTMKLEPNTTYTIYYNRTNKLVSGAISRFYILNWSETSGYTGNRLTLEDATNQQWSFTTDTNGIVAFAWGYNNYATGSSSVITNITLVEGPSPEDHYELCSIGDVRDELIVENGYARVEKKIGKVVFNGNESWTKRTDVTYSQYTVFANSDYVANSRYLESSITNIYSNYFVAKASYSADNMIRIVNTTGYGETIVISNDIASDNSQFRQWVKDKYDSGDPFVIYYVLPKSYTADLGQVDFPTFDGEIKGIAYNGKEIQGIAYNGKVIFSKQEPKPPMPEIVTFADGTDEQIAKMLEAHYRGDINISDYWNVGDTRIMHLDAMPSGTGASESHVAQDMTMVIIGMDHDDLKEPINGKTKAAITLQCKEMLGNNGSNEAGYIWGKSTSTTNTDNYSNNPRRTWLNGTFINALPSVIQPLVKTVVKKNLANHTNNTAGPNTEDKAFLTSYPEMFGSASYSYYKGSVSLEGEQYSYYESNDKRTKYWNNNGSAGNATGYYWLRSPSSASAIYWIRVYNNDSAVNGSSDTINGLAPAFCL